jgi:hypothetical protein
MGGIVQRQESALQRVFPPPQFGIDILKCFRERLFL